MSTLKISAKSIDEVNYVYKRIKKDYEAVGTIKLNQDSMEYELSLERNKLEGALAAICDKVIDMDDMLDEPSIFEHFTWERFQETVETSDAVRQIKGLQKVWKDLSTDNRWACYKYLCEEMELEIVGKGEEVEKY